MVDPEDSRAAWSRYWASGAPGGCLPNATGEIEQAQRAIWRDFARALPKGARVLDLATGGGEVLVRLRAARRDLRLVGVDSADTLPVAPSGIKLRSGVAIETLPFADAAFDAVTSQFGFEYGDAARAPAEIGRVLRPGGRLAMLIHHADGAVVAHNLGRRAGLCWALDERRLIDQAEGVVRARGLSPIATPPAFAAAPAEAAAAFGAGTVAVEIARAVLQTLDQGRARPARESAEVLATLRARARGEIARIDALAAACRSEQGIEDDRAALVAAGVTVEPALPIAGTPGAAPFGWLLAGNRA